MLNLFVPFWNVNKIWNPLKKKITLLVDFFLQLHTGKSGLLKGLKSPKSEYLWAVNMLKGPKECLNLHGSIFVIFFDHSEKKIRPKNYVLVVSEILWLFVKILTPSEKYSLSVKVSVYLNQFKCNYLQTKKCFLNFLLHFRNQHEIWNSLKNKMTFIADILLQL